MVRQNFQRLSSGHTDEVWSRMRAGLADKRTARSLRLATSTVRDYLLRCGGIRPGPRHRAAGRLSFEEREEISRALSASCLCVRLRPAGLGRSALTVSREVAGNGGRGRYRGSGRGQ